MKYLLTLLMLCAFYLTAAAQVYINEVDYDQAGTDASEFLELVGPSGGSLDGYTVELVNGSSSGTGAVYNTIDLAGLSIPDDQVSGFGFFVIGPAGFTNVDLTPSGWTTNQIQNGAPDGILLKLNGTVVDGISYEGDCSTVNSDFTSGMAITAIDPNNSDTLSIGRLGLGFDNSNQDQYFAQDVHTNSPGEINTAHGQVLGGDPPPTISGIVRSPFIPAADEDLVITAEINDDSDITLAQVRYTLNEGDTMNVTMSNGGAGTSYSGTIPASVYNDGDRLSYFIYAEDDAPQGVASGSSALFTGNTDLDALHSADSDGVLLYIGYGAQVTGTATVSRDVFSTTNLDVYMQDDTHGINVFAFGLDPGVVFSADNSYTVQGEVDQFSGKTEIVPLDPLTDITENGPGTVTNIPTLTISAFLAAAEDYEGRLVIIENVTNTGNGDAWPDTLGSFSRNIEISDDGGTSILTMRIDSDTDIIGTPEPNWPVTVRGIFTQFDTSLPYTDGYQLLPRAIDDIAVSTAISDDNGTIKVDRFVLHANYPNPFNPVTTLSFDVPAGAENNQVTLTIFNTLGQEVNMLVNRKFAAGNYEVSWDGSSQTGEIVPSGIYFAVLKAGEVRLTQRMVLIK